jgi:hypothetical protein
VRVFWFFFGAGAHVLYIGGKSFIGGLHWRERSRDDGLGLLFVRLFPGGLGVGI